MEPGSGSGSGSDSGSNSGSSSSSIDNPLEKRPRISDGIDRFSDLPDSMICHILSLLPTKTVVATSILSKRWESLWTKVTSFDLSYDAEAEASDSTRFAQIVNKVLLSRNAERLDKFRLNWEIESEQDAEYVNIWVRYAIARGLQFCSLGLGIEMSENEINLPSTLFTCKTLESLELSGWFTLQVPALVCLPKLQVLNFTDLSLVSNESIYKLISGCPLLHSLTLRMDTLDIALKISSLSLRRLVICNYHEPYQSPVYDKKLEIDAPNLEYLDLFSCSYDCSIKGPCASLNEAVLELKKNYIADADSMNGVYNDRCNSTVKLVGTLNRAKCLTILSDVMVAISRATVPLSTRFERLTKLTIGLPCCEWSSLNTVLACCSRLQLLSLSVSRSETDFRVQMWKEPEQVPECLLSSLTHVSFSKFKGLEDEMSLVRYFLEHGSVLKLFDVTAWYAASDPKLRMLQAISKFPRLSTACSVEFA